MTKPKYQGELDGLCGLYAVANAFQFAFQKDPQRSFQYCCESLAQRRWPEVLWDGTYYGDVIRMIAACRRGHRLQKKMTTRRPFWKKRPANNEEYWKKFDEVMADQNVHCCLIGIEEPNAHWILATPHKWGILFLDSTAGEAMSLKRRNELYAGSKRPDKTAWRINPRELITIETRKK